MKVFISWSGERSKIVALAWERLLKDVLQHCIPFMSKSGIEPGETWFNVLAKELQDTHFGIFCLTPENRHAPWILFEAGAVSKHVDKARICPYLFDMQTTDVQFPLQAFNASIADKDGTKDIIKVINAGIQSHQLLEADLDRAFDRWWPDFEAQLALAKKLDVQTPDRRTDRSMIQELVDLARANVKSSAFCEQVLHRASPQPARYEEWTQTPFQILKVRFIDGPRDGETMEGSTKVNVMSTNPDQTGIIMMATEGEIGGIWNSASVLSISLTHTMSDAAHRRLMDQAPEAYGMQAYQVVEREEQGDSLFLTMKYVPLDKGKEANEFKQRMKKEREQQGKETQAKSNEKPS